MTPILMFTCGYDGQDKRSPLMADIVAEVGFDVALIGAAAF
jgi:methylmalonyl-CoA mutase cobalamin-binding subunit